MSSPRSRSLSERCGLCGRPARSVGPACRRPRGAPRSQSSSWSPGSPASPARAPRSIAGFYGAYQVVLAGIAIGLALDLVLGRWVRATVTGLVVDLGEVAEAGSLRDRLAIPAN